jgi:hypothetical protein
MTLACSTEGAARPLLSGGRRVVVDGHPICDVCGGAVEPVGPDLWHHARPGRGARRIALGKLTTYEEFKARFPWTAASPEDWREGLSRLARYRARLAAAGRQLRLRAGENPFFELVTGLSAEDWQWRMPTGLAQLLELDERRRELASLFSWAIPTEQALDTLARYAPLVECGAGMGYWTALLQSRGVDAIAYDLVPPGAKQRNQYHRARRRPWTEIRRGSSVDAARQHRDRALVLCWPPYDDDNASYAALRAYRGDMVVYIGEREGATGSVRFHRELKRNWTIAEELELPHWPRLSDRLMVYRRNAQPRPHAERDRCFECRRFIPTGAIGRCDECFERRPPALALRVGRHRVEYPQEVVDAMPPALRRAFEASPARIK